MTYGTEGLEQHSPGVKATKGQRIGSLLKLLFTPSPSSTYRTYSVSSDLHARRIMARCRVSVNFKSSTPESHEFPSPPFSLPQPGLRGDKPGNAPRCNQQPGLARQHGTGSGSLFVPASALPLRFPSSSCFLVTSKCSDETGSGFLVPHVTPMQCRSFPTALGRMGRESRQFEWITACPRQSTAGVAPPWARDWGSRGQLPASRFSGALVLELLACMRMRCDSPSHPDAIHRPLRCHAS